MRIRDWSSDVCSSDLDPAVGRIQRRQRDTGDRRRQRERQIDQRVEEALAGEAIAREHPGDQRAEHRVDQRADQRRAEAERSEEHTSELQSLMRISYAVFCLKKKNVISFAPV